MAFFSQNAANVSLLFVHLRQTMIRIMTRLSVNIKKIATLRNARGGDVPDVVKVALDRESLLVRKELPYIHALMNVIYARGMCMIFARCFVLNLISKDILPPNLLIWHRK